MLRLKLPVLARQFLAEFLGTFILISFGGGSGIQLFGKGELKIILRKQSIWNSFLGSGDCLSVALGFGLALMIGILATGVSGGHLNPAVTLSLAVVKKCTWIQFPVYVIAQCLGAFLGAVTLYVNNYKSIE